MNTHTIQLMLNDKVPDVAGRSFEQEAKRYFQISTGKVRSSKIITVLSERSRNEIGEFAENALKDAVLHTVNMGELFRDSTFARYLYIAKLPGVTDDEGISAQKTYADYFNLPPETGEQFIFTGELYYIERALSDKELHLLGTEMLANPLVNHIEYGLFSGRIDYVPTVSIKTEIKTHTVDVDRPGEALEKLSKDMLLSLDLAEMKVIKAYYADEETKRIRREQGMPEQATDCELEVIGQTWSEH